MNPLTSYPSLFSAICYPVKILNLEVLCFLEDDLLRNVYFFLIQLHYNVVQVRQITITVRYVCPFFLVRFLTLSFFAGHLQRSELC